MALQIQSPYIRVADSNGNPYVGAKLYVYLPGTTTLASIYSDDGLSVALSNPLTGVNASNAKGEFPRAYIAAGTYKLRCETSASVLIFQEDNIDTGLSAGTGALPISRGGTGATTAAAARAALDVPSNTELAALSSTISTLSSAVQNIVSQPQGYLTPTTGTPVPLTGVTSGTALYYTPDTGNLVPIYDGTQFNVETFAELTLTLASQHTASNIYDVFAVKDSGTVLIATGPAWSVSTIGSGSRGTGAGSTELTRVHGLYTNANSMTARNGSTTYTVAANRGTYLGSILIDGTNGQITCHRAYGQSRKYAIWNAFNRKTITLKAGDPASSWTVAAGTAVRPSNNSGTNSLTVFAGLDVSDVRLAFRQHVNGSGGSGQTSDALTGISTNGTSINVGKQGRWQLSVATTWQGHGDCVAEYETPMALGGLTFYAMESTANASVANTVFNGTETHMVLSALYQG